MTVHRYYLPPTTPLGVNGDSWSLWLLDDRMRVVSIVSDYGNWAHLWGAPYNLDPEPDMRKWFLDHGHTHYLADKLRYGVTRVFHADETVKRVKEKIVEMRRGGDATEEQARRWYDGIRGVTSVIDYDRFLDLPGAHEVFYDVPKYDVEQALQLQHLTTVSLARVRAAIEAELAAEESATAEVHDRLGARIITIVDCVAERYGLTLTDLLDKRLSKSLQRARRIACLVVREALQASYTEIGQAIGRDYTSVRVAANRAKGRSDEVVEALGMAEALRHGFSVRMTAVKVARDFLTAKAAA